MGFGFNLGMIFFVIPISIIFLLISGITGKPVFSQIVGVVWLFILLVIIFVFVVNLFSPSKYLKKEDFYGEYIIDRNFFSGKQSDWQYNHFRLKIVESDSIFLFLTDSKQLLKTYKGTISTVKPYESERLVINMLQPNHHITETNPTIYRQGRGRFYLVFHSQKFKNMFFRKGKWKKIN